MVYFQRCLVVTQLVPHETAAILVHSVYSIQCHFIQSHIRMVHVFRCDLPSAFLAEWPQDCLHANVVTGLVGVGGWGGGGQGGYGKLTQEKKILLQLLLGLEPMTFQS